MTFYKDIRNVLDRIEGSENFKIAALTASRGCPNKCTFCSSPNFWRRRWRKRDVPNIINEIEYLKSTYGVNTIVFNDENIAANRKWFLELLEALIPLKITWISSGGLSVRAINDKEVLDKMITSGIALFNLAIESGSNKTLNKINKNLTTEEICNAVNIIKKDTNKYAIGFFIIGFPFETWSEIENTVSFAKSLDLDWKSLYCLQPFPGSELYEYCIDNYLIDAFDTNYGEVYYASNINYNNYSAQELNFFSYEQNLLINFINNINVKNDNMQQARRDFNYILKIAPNHVYALNGLSTISLALGDTKKYGLHVNTAKKALMNDWQFWKIYKTAANFLDPAIKLCFDDLEAQFNA